MSLGANTATVTRAITPMTNRGFGIVRVLAAVEDGQRNVASQPDTVARFR
jgi:hypothetical protein